MRPTSREVSRAWAERFPPVPRQLKNDALIEGLQEQVQVEWRLDFRDAPLAPS